VNHRTGRKADKWEKAKGTSPQPIMYCLAVPRLWNRRWRTASRAELVGVGADTALRLYIRPIGIFRAVRVMRLGCNRLKHFLFPGPITPRSARNMPLFRIFSIVEGVLGCPFGVLLQDSPLFFFRRGKGPRNWSRLR